MSLRFHASADLPGAEGTVTGSMAAQSGRGVAQEARGAFIAADAAREGLDGLLAGDALAVTTGQQAGLFTGPLYAVHKALSAAALAQALTRSHGRRFVPVFWVAGDDHDFAEANHCTVLGADGSPERIVLRERDPDAPMLPVFRETVGGDGLEALDALERALPPSDFRDGVLEWLRRAYTPGRSLADACAEALAELLGPFGVVVCRGWDGGLKRAARDVLVAAAREAHGLDAALARHAEQLRARGLPVPVPVGDGLALVMLEGSLGRDRLRLVDAGRFETRRAGETVTLEELESIAANEPERISANVLLRPVVEAFVLPAVCYVGGPGELAYLAQTAPVFERLAVPRPARLPRLSGFLVEGKVDKVLKRLSLSPDDLSQPESELAGRLARGELPDSAAASLADLRSAIEERFTSLGTAASEVDATLARSVDSARNQALKGVNDVERKLLSAVKRANETTLQQMGRVRAQLHPDGAPQERVVSVASFLSRHGHAALEVVYAAAQAHAARLLEASPAAT